MLKTIDANVEPTNTLATYVTATPTNALAANAPLFLGNAVSTSLLNVMTSPLTSQDTTSSLSAIDTFFSTTPFLIRTLYYYIYLHLFNHSSTDYLLQNSYYIHSLLLHFLPPSHYSPPPSSSIINLSSFLINLSSSPTAN